MTSSATLRSRTTSNLPGITVVAGGTALAYGLSNVLGVVSALILATILGAFTRNVGVLRPAVRGGINTSTKRLLRAGIVMLGLQLSVPELLKLRVSDLVVVTATVAVTFSTTRWLGQRFGMGRDRSLLMATGFSICGASAIAAMSGVTSSDDDDVAASIAVITLYGSAAIVGFPLLQEVLNLSDHNYAIWVGASVHEVAQVVAAAAAAGEAAVVVALIAKLGRVVMLAPMVTAVGIARRADAGADRPPIIPLFVVGFLAMCGVRSTGLLPDPALDAARVISTLLLTAAMFGLGSGVHLPPFIRTGAKPALVGALATTIAAGTAYLGIVLLN